MQQKKCRRGYIADVEKLRYLFIPLTNVQILKIRELEPDQCFTDEISEYISLDKSIRTGVLAACSGKLKLTA